MLRQFVVMFVVLFSATAANPAPLYIINDLGLSGRHASHVAINNHGHVAFSVYPESTTQLGLAFLFDGITTIELAGLEGHWKVPAGINDQGLITGFSDSPHETSQGFIYNGLEIGTLPTFGGLASRGFAINNFGHVVGDVFFDHEVRGFIYSPENMALLPTFGGDTTVPTDINDYDEVVGTARDADGNQLPFHYSSGVLTDLGNLGGYFAGASAINENGFITGSSETVDRLVHAFIYHSSYGMRDIDTANSYSEAADINNHNVVVGRAGVSLEARRAFVYDDTNGMRFLDDLLVGNHDWSRIFEATGINDRGQIVGLGYINGETHVFLATPIPEPSMLLLWSTMVAFTSLARCTFRRSGCTTTMKRRRTPSLTHPTGRIVQAVRAR